MGNVPPQQNCHQPLCAMIFYVHDVFERSGGRQASRWDSDPTQSGTFFSLTQTSFADALRRPKPQLSKDVDDSLYCTTMMLLVVLYLNKIIES